MSEPCCPDTGRPAKAHRENPDCPYAAMARYCIGDHRTPAMIRAGIKREDVAD